MQAFAISDDHEAQERVYSALPDWNNDADAIRNALTQDEIPLSDRRVRFVTLAAYEEAGGAIRRDLFAEDECGVYILDPELLDRLAMDKVITEAESIRSEGWKWVEAIVQFDRTNQYFRTRRAEQLPLTQEAEAELTRLSEEYEFLAESQEDPDKELTRELGCRNRFVHSLEGKGRDPSLPFLAFRRSKPALSKWRRRGCVAASVAWNSYFSLGTGAFLV